MRTISMLQDNAANKIVEQEMQEREDTSQSAEEEDEDQDQSHLDYEQSDYTSP